MTFTIDLFGLENQRNWRSRMTYKDALSGGAKYRYVLCVGGGGG